MHVTKKMKKKKKENLPYLSKISKIEVDKLLVGTNIFNSGYSVQHNNWAGYKYNKHSAMETERLAEKTQIKTVI